ncbi:hypothetical protein [Gemmatimonas sp.]|nr:hypothetical protein [Gemmatimonas sp.]
MNVERQSPGPRATSRDQFLGALGATHELDAAATTTTASAATTGAPQRPM